MYIGLDPEKPEVYDEFFEKSETTEPDWNEVTDIFFKPKAQQYVVRKLKGHIVVRSRGSKDLKKDEENSSMRDLSFKRKSNRKNTEGKNTCSSRS